MNSRQSGPVSRPAPENLDTNMSRSEEHTSELQSPCNIVCRLLLEKKNGRPGMSAVHTFLSLSGHEDDPAPTLQYAKVSKPDHISQGTNDDPDSPLHMIEADELLTP